MAFALRVRIQGWLDAHQWMPLGLFVVLPAACIAAMYRAPLPVLRNAALIFALLLFLGFLIFLTFFRREDRGSLGSSVPTILGPLCAQWFVSLKDDKAYSTF